MIYGSVCSGIEAASVAWEPLGWKAAFFSEIEKFPRAVLSHHYPGVPLHGDFTTIKGEEYGAIDLLVGGTPCQSFSVAGLRGGMADPRGNLALGFLGLASRARPCWLVWENVPGVLSSNGGKDFGSFLGGLVELGYGFAYRVLDAQFFGVAQRRRRVFVVGYLGNWHPAVAVLFERESVSGDNPPRRKPRERAASCARRCAAFRYQNDSEGIIRDDISATLRRESATTDERSVPAYVLGDDFDTVPTLVSNGDAHSGYRDEKGLVVAAFKGGQGSSAGGIGYDEHLSPTLSAADSGSNRTPTLLQSSAVRRLTPRECERLQGFPDDYTLIPVGKKTAADGPRYKALGNSMAVPVMRWIGERIQLVDKIIQGGEIPRLPPIGETACQ